ncbi:MAG: glycerol acyltransferase [Bacteroidia bacterium]|nr:glycerol acyltransferase [Bacteroidia bacterium]
MANFAPLRKNRNVEEEKSETFKPISIREVFASKNARLARLMPGFVYRYINRIMHIDFINGLLKRNGQLKGMDFVEKVVTEFNVKEHIYGIENIPETGRFIFASNHPLGGFDGMLLMRIINRKLGEFKSLTNDILFNIPNLRPLFVPVNKHGGHSRQVAKILDETYNSEQQIMVFPSGLASRKIKGKIVDLEWKKHFIAKAVQHQRDVIPVFISGRNSNRFYRIANLRKFLKIKWNLEMFFLADETMKHRNTEISIYFGKPLPYSMFNKTRSQSEWASYVKKIVYQLPGSISSGNLKTKNDQ